MKAKGRRWGALAMAALLALAAGCSALAPGGGPAGTRPADAGPVKLGMVTSTSGGSALFGQAGVDGAKIAVDELNASGGVLGRRIELIVRDDEGKTDVGARETRDLILSQKVSALLGPVSSAILLAISPIAKENKTVLLSHTANTERAFWEQGHAYIFSVVPNTQIEGAALGLYLAKLPYKRYVIIAPDYEFGHIQSEAWKKKLQELRPDVVVVKELFPKLGEKDFTSFITAALAEQPEAVYSNLFGSDLVAFTKQAKNYGFFEKVRFAALYDVDTLQALGPDAVPGVIGYDRGPFHAIRKLAPSERFDKFVDEYRKRTGKWPSTWAINAYDAVMAWAKAAQKAGDVASDRVAPALEGLELDSLRGPGRYIDKYRHQANVGSYIGVVDWAADFKEFATYREATYIPGDQVWRSEEEIKQIREKAGNR